MNEKYEINQLPLGLLIPFKNHPFKVIQNEELNTLAQSIRESGVLVPALARPAGDRYELISGHRRLAACKLLGLPTIPVIVRDLTDEEAIITLVDANLQREHILPSEKAFAYKMKMEAMKHQGKTSCQVGTKSRTDGDLAKDAHDSARQIQRYIRLTYLIPEILDMVDNKEIALTPAVEISYLTKWEQKSLYKIMQMEGATPSLSQAQRMRRMSEERRLGEGDMEDIMSEIKGNQVECIRITEERFRKHFRRDVTPLEMAEIIDKALEYYQRYLDRQQER